MSNLELFKNCFKQLYGCTGTMGNDATQNLLRKTYEISCVMIPPFKKTTINPPNLNKLYICKELLPIIKNNEDAWYKEIVNSVFQMLKLGRGVLVIC